MTARSTLLGQLRRLARLYHVQTGYSDAISGDRQEASVETLLAVLDALGAGVRRAADVPEALRRRESDLAARPVEPVAVVRGRANPRIELALPAHAAQRPIPALLTTEDGAETALSLDPRPTAPRARTGRSGPARQGWEVRLPVRLDPGYHRLRLELPGTARDVRILVAPERPLRGGPAGGRTWGVFLPLYALQSRRSWGCGDLGDLEALMEWVGARGGGVVATLPLLAAFLDEPFEPSPYAPVSRCFWNELYLDVERLAGTGGRRENLERTLESLRRRRKVDYRRAMAVRRGVLEKLARAFFRRPAAARREFTTFLAARPDLEDYARFRAVCESRREGWRRWPARLRDGRLRGDDADPDAVNYHLYVQWRMDQQMESFSRRAREHGPGLYLDLPIGVHPDGYDVWRNRPLFAVTAEAGAPPDAFFTKGQSWGFPPLHPDRIREDGYAYVIACLRHHFRHAGILRIDHVMGLHRLFWVPSGMDARRGAYVRYASEELYAVLAIEAARAGAVVVGEDLGTVPRDVRPAMARNGLYRSYVLQYEVGSDLRSSPPAPPRLSMAGLNTHDMPTFTAFWKGLDLADRQDLGLLDRASLGREMRARRRVVAAIWRWLRRQGRVPAGKPSPERALRGLLSWLASGPARVVIVNLEDLLAEVRPQNTPGTTSERDNWVRKARYNLESITSRRDVGESLAEVDRWRRRPARGAAAARHR